MDHITGIIKSGIVDLYDISSTLMSNESLSVELKKGANWFDLRQGMNQVKFSITAQNSDSGLIFAYTITIQVPKSKITSDFEAKLRRFNGRTIVYKYRIGINDFVAGTKRWPLRVTICPIVGTSLSNYGGYKIDINGEIPFLPYSLS